MSSTYPKKLRKTIVVDLTSGTKQVYPFTSGGVVRSEDEQRIVGLVELDEDAELIKVHMGAAVRAIPMAPGRGDAADTLLIGDTLVIGYYDNIATGSALLAADRRTGKLLWRADVKQLAIEHSEYYNTVRVSRYRDKVAMEGIEAGGHYLQVFDRASGRRLYSTF